jgi:hypothetical protein
MWGHEGRGRDWLCEKASSTALDKIRAKLHQIKFVLQQVVIFVTSIRET